MSLDHVQLAAPAGCEQAARDFFAGVLGLREIEKPPGLSAGGGVWFALTAGHGQLHVGVAPSFAPAAKAHPALRVADDHALEALAARLQRAGAEIDWDDRITGRRRFFTSDPWGNRIELLA